MCGCEPPLPGKLKRKNSLALKFAQKMLNSIVCFPQFGVSLFFLHKTFFANFSCTLFRLFNSSLSLHLSLTHFFALRIDSLAVLSAFCLCTAKCQNCHLPSFCPISKTQRKTNIPSKLNSLPFACFKFIVLRQETSNFKLFDIRVSVVKM